ncbi:YciI family protein [Roseateles sp. BYS87W]|uniref:YciI family protein n=1 Tax=Pelomonas baiyunensis TaxID=3299026 RepID=A0ABW7H304_9BURK
MTHYLISFPAAAMQVPPHELPAVGDAARAVVREAKAAGVYVFAGGIHSGVAPLRVQGDGHAGPNTDPAAQNLDGGFCVLKLPTRDAAVQWAAKIAAACRCAQELREFAHDPES